MPVDARHSETGKGKSEITTYRINATSFRKWQENKGTRIGTVIAKDIIGIVVH
jgi:hypothetical protein